MGKRCFGWGHLLSGLVGGLVVVLVLAAVPVLAGNGDALVLGASNRAGRSTWLTSRGSSTLKLTNTGGSPPLVLRTRAGAAPLVVDSDTRVEDLNADLLDGRHASAFARTGHGHTGLEVPSGAVMFFNATICPSGWSAFERAQGRTVVGLNPGGNLGQYTASALSDGSSPVTNESDPHQHYWARFTSWDKSWGTWDWGGDGLEMMDWGDGIGSEGSGYYPIAPTRADSTDDFAHYYSTQVGGHHSHEVWLPYVQLLACEKD